MCVIHSEPKPDKSRFAEEQNRWLMSIGGSHRPQEERPLVWIRWLILMMFSWVRHWPDRAQRYLRGVDRQCRCWSCPSRSALDNQV